MHKRIFRHLYVNFLRYYTFPELGVSDVADDGTEFCSNDMGVYTTKLDHFWSKLPKDQFFHCRIEDFLFLLLTFLTMCATMGLYHGCGIVSPAPRGRAHLEGGRLYDLRKEIKIGTR